MALVAFFTATCLLSFEAVTAPFLICRVPTLFAGRLVAAYVVPPSATNSAISEMTKAGLGARNFLCTVSPFSPNSRWNRTLNCRRRVVKARQHDRYSSVHALTRGGLTATVRVVRRPLG